MNKRFLLTFDVVCVFVIVVLLFAVRWRQFNASLKRIEWDELAWVTTSFLRKYDILAEEKSLDRFNDDIADSFPTSLKINELGFYIFGDDFYSARKILALFNILSMLTFYLLCRRFFNSIVSFCITILYSFSTYKLIIARIAVEPAYADLFLYLFVALILLISNKNKKWLNYIYSLIAVLGIILGTFSYSLSFFFPILGFTLILLQLIKNKLKLKEKVIILLIFVVPLTMITPRLIRNVKHESEIKEYAIKQIVFDFENKQLNLEIFFTNAYIVQKNLFKTIAYRSGDMVVDFEGTLIPSPVVYLAIFGFLISLFNITKYYPLQIWFGLSFIPIFLFGLLAARMWVNTVGVFFIFSGIAIQRLINLKEIKDNRFTPIFLYFFIFIIIFVNLIEYYKTARYNPSFHPRVGELVQLASEFKKNLTSNIAFISDREFSEKNIYPITTFYYLAEHPEQKKRIKHMTKEDMLVFTHDAFIELGQYKLDKYKYIAVDVNYREEVINLIESNLGKKIKKKHYDYFSLLEI